MRIQLMHALGVFNAFAMINSLYEGIYSAGFIYALLVLWTASDRFWPTDK